MTIKKKKQEYIYDEEDLLNAVVDSDNEYDVIIIIISLFLVLLRMWCK